MINANRFKPSNTVLSNLPCFCAAARSLSFTVAAEELCLTQGAVSHRIKKLEEELGFVLFLRFNRKLQLTSDGQKLLTAATSLLQSLDTTIRDIHTTELCGELNLSAPPSFALNWLTPHLSLFQQQHPQLKLRIESHSRLVDFSNERIDLAIYYGQGEYPGLSSTLLKQEYLTPVCSPSYAEKHDLLGTKKNLRNVTLLHDMNAWPDAGMYAEWQYWGEKNNHCLNVEHSYCFDLSELALQSAIAGQGVAIGRRLLLEAHLDSRKLIQPFASAIESPQSYYAVCHPNREQHPAVNAFKRWILDEIQ